MHQALTFFDKVWNEHVIADLGDGAALIQMDRLFLHELAGPVVLADLDARGRSPAAPQQVFSIIDHVVSTRPGRGINDVISPESAGFIEQTRELSRKHKLHYFDTDDRRQGIVHVVAPELGAVLPGMTAVCTDSHTSTLGGIGAIAWGIGFSEAKHVLHTQTLMQTKPKTMRMNFEGELPAGVFAKDMILALIGRYGANGGAGYAVEFAGEAVRGMPIEGRLTLCNMAIEFSARAGFVAPDEATLAWLKGREYAPTGAAWDAAAAFWRALPSEQGAEFDAELTIDCSLLQPQITWGTSPQHVTSITGSVPLLSASDDEGTKELVARALSYIRLDPGTPMRGVPIDVAYIGSCTNARLSDLRAAAEVLRGRKIAAGVLAVCVPGSIAVKTAAEEEGLDRVFTDAGFEWHTAGCGMCGNAGRGEFADKRVISSTNRNFQGRQGPQTRTHLASPATVAASAVAGCFADPRDYPALH
jgi:3-isopropylmalate/(R)-2-methylmalate dehydratase large subunit